MEIVQYSHDSWGQYLHGQAQKVRLYLKKEIEQAEYSDLRDRLEDIADGNIGYATLLADRVQRTYLAFSGIQTAKDRLTLDLECVYLRPDRERWFRTLIVDNRNRISALQFDRKYDTESKIFEEIARDLEQDSNAAGSIYVYTERYPCPSCRSVIDHFQTMYGQVEIYVYYAKR